MAPWQLTSSPQHGALHDLELCFLAYSIFRNLELHSLGYVFCNLVPFFIVHSVFHNHEMCRFSEWRCLRASVSHDRELCFPVCSVLRNYPEPCSLQSDVFHDLEVCSFAVSVLRKPELCYCGYTFCNIVPCFIMRSVLHNH